MLFIKVVIKIRFPLDPSSHSYILRKYVRVISPPKGILGLVGVLEGVGGGHIFMVIITSHQCYVLIILVQEKLPNGKGN